MSAAIAIVQKLQGVAEHEYRRGRDDGYTSGFNDGYAKGRADAQHEFDEALAEFLAQRGQSGGQPEQPEQPEIRIREDMLRPSERKALDWLRENQGSTQMQAMAAGATGNNSMLYRLARLGLARKDGPQFYAV